MPRKSYDKQFKLVAVKPDLKDDISVSEIVKESSILYNTLYNLFSYEYLTKYHRVNTLFYPYAFA